MKSLSFTGESRSLGERRGVGMRGARGQRSRAPENLSNLTLKSVHFDKCILNRAFTVPVVLVGSSFHFKFQF